MWVDARACACVCVCVCVCVLARRPLARWLILRVRGTGYTHTHPPERGHSGADGVAHEGVDPAKTHGGLLQDDGLQNRGEATHEEAPEDDRDLGDETDLLAGRLGLPVGLVVVVVAVVRVGVRVVVEVGVAGVVL